MDEESSAAALDSHCSIAHRCNVRTELTDEDRRKLQNLKLVPKLVLALASILLSFPVMVIHWTWERLTQRRDS